MKLTEAQLLAYAQTLAASESPPSQDIDFCRACLENLELSPEAAQPVQDAITTASKRHLSVAASRFPGLAR